MLVLGISCFYHDAAAALVKDGTLVAAAEEERFSRRKHDDSFPEAAIAYCLREAGATPGDIDHIVFYEKPLLKFDRILQSVLAGWPRTLPLWVRSMPVWMRTKLRIGRIIQRALSTDQDIFYCTHHLSHAASAFLVSGFDEAAILTADGVGEWGTTAWGVGRGVDIELRGEIDFPHSLGLLYSALTAYLGFRVNDAEWKVMGLAAYGRPRYLQEFRQLLEVREDGSFRLKMEYFAFHRSTRRSFSRKWERLLGRAGRRPETPLDEFHADIACSGQKVIEEVLLRIAEHVRRATGLDALCIGGGVGLNCVANWRILQEAGFKQLFVQPAAGDSGGAVGAAYCLYNSVLRQPRSWVMRDALLGPAFSDDEIAAVLTRRGAAFQRIGSREELLAKTAGHIAAGKVVGWFQGRMEFGPRALGARSLLADPRDARMKDIINAKVKFRESFRPFAPAVLKERAHEFFEMPPGMDAPFMLLTPPVRAEKREVIPAVTHADGTARVQTVDREANALFYDLIAAFGQQTGVPVVVNTSFNVRGEPIVCTPEEAYDCFLRTGIDVLVMGNCVLVQKPEADLQAGFRRSVELEQAALAAD